jgi:hypothetical protein
MSNGDKHAEIDDFEGEDVFCLYLCFAKRVVDNEENGGRKCD